MASRKEQPRESGQDAAVQGSARQRSAYPLERGGRPADSWPAHLNPCVWMDAGVVVYKLCDRGFDCDDCPLDRGLRGIPNDAPGPTAGAVGGALCFPQDRRYASSHVWARTVDDAVTRMGVDCFAARLLGGVVAVRFVERGASIRRGDTVAEIELAGGKLAIRCPFAGVVYRDNRSLAQEPRHLVEDPYGEGWLLELHGAPAESDGFIDSVTFAQHTEHDSQRFRRQFAVHLWDSDEQLGPLMADGGAPLIDLRDVFSPYDYVSVVRNLIG